MTEVLNIQNIVKFINEIPQINTIQYLHETIGRNGIRVTYEKEDNFDIEHPKYKRIILTTFYRKTSFEFPGIIISPDFEGVYRIISVPPAPPINLSQKLVKYDNQNTSPVTATKVQDGTTITLYMFRDRWCISTYRGIEVSYLKATKDKTYKQLLEDALSIYNDFSFERLDRNKSYTIGFYHSDFHPFQTTIDPTRNPSVAVWFIQSSNIINFNKGLPFVNYRENIGLPFQESVTVPSIHQLFDSAENAYKKFVECREVNYGYLLRNKHRYFLIESTLLKNIRMLFYAHKFNKLDPVFEKRKYIILSAFLTASKYEIFLNLFPQYKSEFQLLQKEVDRILNIFIKIIYTNSFVPATLYDIKINEWYQSISKHISLHKVKRTEAIGFILTIIYDEKNIDMIYKLIYSK